MQALFNAQQLQAMQAKLYNNDDNFDYYFNCNFTVDNITVTHMRVTSNTVMLQHNAQQNLFNKASFLQALNTLLNTTLHFNDNWDSNYVELAA